jgi:hypothetical protein
MNRSSLAFVMLQALGVTTSQVHLAMWSTAVGIHIDNYDLLAFNYLHVGAPKIWYIIHPSSYERFERMVHELQLFGDTQTSCQSPLQHHSLLIKPSFLHSHSIDFFRIEQKCNELVIIFPGTYYFHFDTGFNICETVRFALPSCLSFQRRSPRLCSCETLASSYIHLNRRFFTTDIVRKFHDTYLSSKSTGCIDLSTGTSIDG